MPQLKRRVFSDEASSSFPNCARAYCIKSSMASGAFGTIYRAKCMKNGKNVAIKVIRLKHLSRLIAGEDQSVMIDSQELSRESSLMANLQHKNIIQHYTTFYHKQQIWLVMNLCKFGSTHDIMKYCDEFNNGFKDPKILSCILKDVCEGVRYLHSKLIIHRDIKPSNILINNDGRAVITDFGTSTCLIKGGLRKGKKSKTTGTPVYMAPELMKRESYCQKVDIWSVGISVLALAFGKPPNYNVKNFQVCANILDNKAPSVDSQGKNNFSNKFKKFVDYCLIKDKAKRQNIDSLLKLSFFKILSRKDNIGKYIIDNVISKSYKYVKNSYKKIHYNDSQEITDSSSDILCEEYSFSSLIGDNHVDVDSPINIDDFDVLSEKLFRQLSNKD